MQHKSNDRVKSMNLINHIAPDRRKNKPTTSSNSSTTESTHITKMVHDTKKIETGLLVGM